MSTEIQRTDPRIISWPFSLYMLSATFVVGYPAVASPDYGFYQFLRIYISVASVVAFFWLQRGPTFSQFRYVFLGLAILFNPLVPIHLSRGIWLVIDFASAWVFFGAFAVTCPANRE